MIRAMLADESEGYVATRSWVSADGSVERSLTWVDPPQDEPFAYAERRVPMRPGRAAEYESYSLAGEELTRTFRRRLASGVEMDEERTLLPAGVGQVSVALTDRTLCSICVNGARGIGIAGFIVNRIANTPMGKAVCAMMGLGAGAATTETGPGAIVAGTATYSKCERALAIAGTISAIIGTVSLMSEADTYAQCDRAADMLGLGPICANSGPRDDCNLRTVLEEKTLEDRCVQLGRCARANNCNIEGICTGTKVGRREAMRRADPKLPEVCDRIVSDTCSGAWRSDDDEVKEMCRTLIAQESAGGGG
jgi:hypothetical protein